MCGYVKFSILNVTIIVTLSILFVKTSMAQEQEVTISAENWKLMRAPQALDTLGTDLFGDKLNTYTGTIEFLQTDVSLKGNNALPVSVGRRLVIGRQNTSKYKHFKNWELDIPRISGTFSTDGWQVTDGAGGASVRRCTNFGPPPEIFTNDRKYRFRSTEYWYGHMLYVPGHGEQEILRRNVSSSVQWPNDGAENPLVTRNFWVLRCVNNLSSTDASTPPGDVGEGFVAISPDGSKYRFDWLVRRPVDILSKAVGRNRKHHVVRVEVLIYPTQVVDRFGNSVNYRFDTVDKWKLLEIRSSDGLGNPDRLLTFEYIPGTRHIASVSDGVRTWRYDYAADRFGRELLSTVILPDQSMWQLGGLGAESMEQPGINNLTIEYSEPGPEDPPPVECDGAPPDVRNGLSIGRMVHPSGAIGTFIMEPMKHGRSGVPKKCYTDTGTDGGKAYYPRMSDVFSLKEKIVEGPGISPMKWTMHYDTLYPAWEDCVTCNVPVFVNVTDPNGVVTRHTFGNTFAVDEGMPQRVDIGWGGGVPIRSTFYRYNQGFSQPVGFSDQDRGNSRLSARIVPQDQRIITQQNVDFKWEVPSSLDFDDKGRANKVFMTSDLGRRSQTLIYNDDLQKWIINRLQSINDIESGLVAESRSYHANSGSLESISKFGKLVERYAYHADGSLASRSDEGNPPTILSDYKRGIPRKVTHPDNTIERAEVNLYGAVTKYIDQTGHVTNYEYDSMGRLSRIIYPPETNSAWNDTQVTFNKVPYEEFGLAAGHWRQDVLSGAGQISTSYDALWRPVVVSKLDLNDVSNTSSVTQSRYDFAGNKTFSSYPRRSYTPWPEGVENKYDALGRVTEVVTDSELGKLTSNNDYLDGFQKRVTDNRRNSTVYSFQAFDRPDEKSITLIAAPEGVNVSIVRDTFGKTLGITRGGNGKTLTRSYVYDAHQRLCKTIEPEVGATTQGYDKAGNISWKATGLNLVSNLCDSDVTPHHKKNLYGYDALNRLISTTFGDGSSPVHHEYTLDGLLKKASSNDSIWEYEYNSRRLNVAEIFSYGGKRMEIKYGYDANGSISELSYPFDGFSLRYNPDALGQARQIGGYAFGIKYHPDGAVAEFTYGNGIQRKMTQNTRGLPLNFTDDHVFNETYSYDANGNVEQVTDVQEGLFNRSMSYDGMERLTSTAAENIWGLASYSYDALDNIISSTIGGGSGIRSLVHEIDPSTNRLQRTSGTSPAFNFVYEYDSQGNVIKRGDRIFDFDQANRMTRARGVATYLYDGLGRRFSTVSMDQVNVLRLYSRSGQLIYSGPTNGGGIKYLYLNKHQIAEVK